MPQACLFTVVELPITSEDTLPTTEQTQDQLEVPMLSSCVSSPTDDDCTNEQDDEQLKEECVGKQSEEQSIEHVGEQTDKQSAEHTSEQSEEQSAEHMSEQSEEQSAEHVGEEQHAEPPPLISEPTNPPETRAGAESNLLSVLPLPLSEHYKKFSISEEKDVHTTAEQLFYSLNFSSEECSGIEHATRHQRNSDEWYRQQQGRLTASDFHRVFSMRKQTDPTSVAECLLSKPDISHLPAVQWAINNEDAARQDYIKEMSSHTNFVCTNAGLVVNPLFPHLGASPDGFVCCDCCWKGLL